MTNSIEKISKERTLVYFDLVRVDEESFFSTQMQTRIHDIINGFYITNMTYYNILLQKTGFELVWFRNKTDHGGYIIRMAR